MPEAVQSFSTSCYWATQTLFQFVQQDRALCKVSEIPLVRAGQPRSLCVPLKKRDVNGIGANEDFSGKVIQ